MGSITGVIEGEARAYFANAVTTSTTSTTSTSVATETITGKTLPASAVVISNEARERLVQAVAEPVTSEQQNTNYTELLASKFSNQGPSVNLGYELFNDPNTSWDAGTFIPILNMTADNTQSAMDDFANALHDVLADGQVGRNQYDNSDTSEAMALTLTQAKLHKLIDKYVSADNQTQANDIVDGVISGKIAAREQQTLQSAQDMLDIATRYGTDKIQADARDYLEQVKSGTARPQVELAGMMEAMKSGNDMDSVFSTFADLILATPNPGNAAQTSINAAMKQLDVYKQQWQAFSEKYAS